MTQTLDPSQKRLLKVFLIGLCLANIWIFGSVANRHMALSEAEKNKQEATPALNTKQTKSQNQNK